MHNEDSVTVLYVTKTLLDCYIYTNACISARWSSSLFCSKAHAFRSPIDCTTLSRHPCVAGRRIDSLRVSGTGRCPRFPSTLLGVYLKDVAGRVAGRVTVKRKTVRGQKMGHATRLTNSVILLRRVALGSGS